jgi:uncharacterized protein YndB with AHSA1/START domain
MRARRREIVEHGGELMKMRRVAGRHACRRGRVSRIVIGVVALVLAALMACAPRTRLTKGDNMFDVQNVTVSIQRPPQAVYDFITDGANIPRWAAGLGGTSRRVGEDWLVEGPLGSVRVRFAAPNELGVADHEVVLGDGQRVHNPMRVLPNGAGSSVVFTLFRRPPATEADFERDAAAVRKDLETLRVLLERS